MGKYLYRSKSPSSIIAMYPGVLLPFATNTVLGVAAPGFCEFTLLKSIQHLDLLAATVACGAFPSVPPFLSTGPQPVYIPFISFPCPSCTAGGWS
jgi:hypothetical protein